MSERAKQRPRDQFGRFLPKATAPLLDGNESRFPASLPSTSSDLSGATTTPTPTTITATPTPTTTATADERPGKRIKVLKPSTISFEDEMEAKYKIPSRFDFFGEDAALQNDVRQQNDNAYF